jgi:hypothetical protein
MSKAESEAQVLSLMMRGHAAKEGIQKQMEDAIEELKAMRLRYKNEQGDKGEAAFICALSVFTAELQL